MSRISVEELARELHATWNAGEWNTVDGAFSQVAKRAIELLGPTAEERAVIAAALEWTTGSYDRPDLPQQMPLTNNLLRACRRLRESRQPEPRFYSDRSLILDRTRPKWVAHTASPELAREFTDLLNCALNSLEEQP